MWYFKKIWYKWNEQSHDFKMNRWAEILQAECIESIDKDLDKLSKDLTHASERYEIKKRKDLQLNEYTNLLDIRERLPNPIFTQDQIAEISRNNIKDNVLGFFFIVLEGFIFSQLVSSMIPREIRKQFWFISIIVGIILSMLLLLAVKTALEHYFNYVEASNLLKQNKEQKQYQEKVYKLAILRQKRNFALIFLLGFLGFSVFAGFLREQAMLGAAAETNPFMGKMVFMMSLTLSILVVLVLAIVQRDLVEKNIKFEQFKNWKKHEKERKTHMEAIESKFNSNVVSSHINKQLQKYWSLMLDLHDVFGQEYDLKEKQLYEEFRDLPKPIEITNDIYQRFKYIQSAEKSLFAYNITNDERLKAKSERLNEEIDKFHKDISKYKNKYNETVNPS